MISDWKMLVVVLNEVIYGCWFVNSFDCSEKCVGIMVLYQIGA